MSESNKESRVGSFCLSSSELSTEEQQREAGSGKTQNNYEGSKAKESPTTSHYESLQEGHHTQRDAVPKQNLDVKHEAQEDYEKVVSSAQKETSDDVNRSIVSLPSTAAIFTGPGDHSPRRMYPHQQQMPSTSKDMERTFAARGRTVNEMDSGSYSHYPTSDARTDEEESGHENTLTGPGFNMGSSARGRIWESERYDDWKGKNRERERNRQPESTTMPKDSREQETFYQSSTRRSSQSAEMTLPVSKVRESGEDYSYSYSATSASTTIHRNQEDISIAASTSSKPSTTLSSSISRVEENSATPSAHRARGESVSGSTSTLAMTPASDHHVAQSRHSTGPLPQGPPSPLNTSRRYHDERRQQPWGANERPLPSISRSTHLQNDPPVSNTGRSPQIRVTDRMPPPDIDDPVYYQSRSHVSRSPDISYFQNASRSGSSSTNAVLQGTVTYQRQQGVLKESRHTYTETSSEKIIPRIQSDQPVSAYSHPRSVNDGVIIERPHSFGYEGDEVNFGRQYSRRSKQSMEDTRSHGGSTSGTPPTPDNRDILKQPAHVEYHRTVPRQDERPTKEGKRPQQEHERHENFRPDAAQNSSAGIFGVLKSIRSGPSESALNPSSKVTSSYSTPSTTSASLSPVLSKSLPSLRETFVSPTVSVQSLPPPRSLSSTSSGRPQTVSIPPAQATPHTAPGGPWLYDGEEPDLEEDEGLAVVDESERPKKRRRTRVALSCAECKRRKIKCDRAQPCTPCARRGDQSNCKWAVMETKDGAPTRAEFEVLQNRVLQLERLISSIAPQLKTSP